MTNRRHSREPKPALAPKAAEPARFEPRPFSASDRPSTPDVQPHVAPAGVGHDFGQLQAPIAPLTVQPKLMAGTGGEQGVAQASQVHQAIQAKALTAAPAADDHAPPAGDKRAKRQPASAKRRPNQTGLPDQLKSGIETLSGMSMDDVHVHYGSPQPAQLNALAYAQGSDIHIAPGQEQHLPHEAWHVVQQAQGRVKPTMQMKEGVPANDDTGLEHEADVMGGRALASAADPARPDQESASPPLQTKASAPVQLKKLVTMGGTFDTGQYEAVTGPIEVKAGEHTQDVGGVIDMSFVANAEVTGSFGLVQTGKAIRNKQPDYNKDRTDLKERMQDEHGSDPGRFMDRSKYKENPIFGLQNQKELLGGMEGGVGTNFTDNRNAIAQRASGSATQPATIVKASVDEEDHNISDVGGKVGSRTSPLVAVPASMRDEPARTRHLVADETTGDAIRMEFETASLVLNGDMEGTYLGSVQWGFEISETDKKGKPLPFEIVSMGTPTPAFMESANAWNEQAIVNTGGSNTTQSLPLHVTNHAPDLELQKLIADESAAKEEKILALQARIAKLTSAQEAMDPAVLLKLKQAVAEATVKFDQAKVAVGVVKQQRKELAESVDPLRTKRQKAGAKQKAGQTALDEANTNLDRIGNKTPFYKARKKQDEIAVKAATDTLAQLDLALSEAREAVTKAEAGIAKLDKKVAGFNKSDEVMGYRDAKIKLQNEKADLGNVSFELAHLLKALDKLQSE